MKKLIILPLFLLSFALLHAQQDTREKTTEQPSLEKVDAAKHDVKPRPIITGEDIQLMASRNIYDIMMVASSQIEVYGTQVYLKGAPAAVYVDGVKTIGPIGLPQKAIAEVKVLSDGADVP